MKNLTKKDVTILNYDDYENGYVNAIYKYIIDNYTFCVACSDETAGLDIIIDHLESEGLENWFIDVEVDNEFYVIDSIGDRYYDDLYIIGGNHSRYLYTGGDFRVEEINIYYK